MAVKLEVYKCEICGNMVEVLAGGEGELVCCNQPMKLMPAKTAAQEGKEKHVPVIEKGCCCGTTTVKVGSVPHPMEEKHFIQWVEIVTKDGITRKYLKPGEKPEAVFAATEDIIEAREYCNIHGLWTSK